jgi:hypothetical protein
MILFLLGVLKQGEGMKDPLQSVWTRGDLALNNAGALLFKKNLMDNNAPAL